jgi:hypothetical protein
MSIEVLLSRLDGVRKASDGRWMAKCPAHEDRSPSLSIRELRDGMILLHDFGGCSSEDVLFAVGLSMADLFEDSPVKYGRSRKPNHHHAAFEALKSLEKDSLLVAMGAESLAAGYALTDKDRDGLIQAHQRATKAWEMVR